MKYVLCVRPRLAQAIPLMVLLLAACWGGAAGKKPVGPTVPTEAPPTSTTAPPDVSTVPAVIDEAYLNEVLKALNKVDGDAMRLIVQEEDLVRPAAERFRSIYLGENLNDELRRWGDQVGKGFDNFRKPPGDKVNQVRRIITARPDCVYVETVEDASAVLVRATQTFVIFVGLKSKVATEDPNGFNPTPWMITFAGTSPDQTDPGMNPCLS